MTSSPHTYRLPARVEFENAPQVLEAAAPAIAAGARVLDLADCHQFDSSLIAVLLALSRQAAAASGGAPAGPAVRCKVHNAPSNLRKLAALYGVDGLLLD